MSILSYAAQVNSKATSMSFLVRSSIRAELQGEQAMLKGEG